MIKTFKSNTEGYKVLTPDGFKSFAGVSLMGIKPILRLEFEKDVWIECTFDHKLYVSDLEYKFAKDFEIGDCVMSSKGPLALIDIVDLGRSEPVYDLIEVDDGRRYYANSIVSSNCEFLIFDETLINSITLSDMKGVEPIMRMGQTRWYENVKKGKTYLVSLDPAMGTGGDHAAIEVFELPGMIQVAEWQHNNTPIQAQIRILKEICKYITDNSGDFSSAPKVYYSVENNTLGEAALVAINELGEENIPGLFLSEPIRKGHVRKFRKGFNTTHNAKIAACSKLKQLIETNTIKIKSKPLISQLKGFIARGTTFAAKSGERDDLVMSMLLAIRMLNILSDWDPAVYDLLRTGEEIVLPMPILMS